MDWSCRDGGFLGEQMMLSRTNRVWSNQFCPLFACEDTFQHFNLYIQPTVCWITRLCNMANLEISRSSVCR